MVDLKSVSRPAPSAFESAAVEASRRTTEGKTGTLESTEGLSARMLIATGKGDPIRPPAVPGADLFESVIGPDDRTRILDTEAHPWRRICALRMRAGNSAFVGTGWLAGPRTIITAGHCVHSTQMGGWADSIEVSPARNGDLRPFDAVPAANYSTLSVWFEDADPDFDIGAIHLAEPVGDQVGFFATGALAADELEDHFVNISGYPADRGRGTEQWFHRNRVLQVTERRLFYDVDTFGGHSGAPVFVVENEGDEPLVVAIHAYGIGGTPASFGITANSGPRISQSIFDLIQFWIEEDNAAADT